jgi:CBS domain-containing protein
MDVLSILNGKGRDVVSVSPGSSVADVLEELHRHQIGAVLVTDGREIVGLLSERDIVRALHTQGVSILDSRVDSIMVAPVITIEPDWTVAAAMELMTLRRVRHLPVVLGDELLGMVSIGDLVKFRIEEAEREAQALKEYIRSA